MSQRRPDIGFIPAPPEAIEEMLKLAQIMSEDVLYDLGCGDGRILIQAAQQFGCRGVGIDIDPVRIQEARDRAKQMGVGDRLEFRLEDLYESNFSEATVLILYLLPHLNLKLRPQIFRQLKPGSRIVSCDFDMGDWEPTQVVNIPIEEESTVYYWIVPEHPSGG